MHVSTASTFHQGFPWLQSTQAKFTIFRVHPVMLLLIRLTKDRRRLMLLPCGLASYTYFHFAYQFSTGTLALTDDSLVRVSRRVYKSRFDNITKVPHSRYRSNMKLRQAGKSTCCFTLLEAILSLSQGKHGSIGLVRLAPFGTFSVHPLSDQHSRPSGQLLYLPFQRFQVF